MRDREPFWPDLPALPGIHYAVETLDLVMSRPPKGAALPVVVFGAAVGSPLPEQVVRGLRRRLVDEAAQPALGAHPSLVPHALLEDGGAPASPAGGLALMDDLANQLEGSMPTGAGRLRLRTFHLCRDLLEAPGVRGSLADRRTKLLEYLYDRRLARRTVPRLLERFDPAQVPSSPFGSVLATLMPVVRFVPRWWYGQRLTRGSGLRWFTEQMRRITGAPDVDFLTSALRLAEGGREHDDATVVRSILVHALVQDLEAARGRRWRHVLGVLRRRRRWPFVLLLLTGPDPASALRELLETYVDVVRSRESTPLLVLAAAAGERPACARDAGARSLRDLADELQEPRRTGRSQVHYVALDAAEVDGAAESWLQVNRKVPVQPNRLTDFARPVLAVAVVLTLSIGTVQYLAERRDPCRDTWTTSLGERVGVTDGSCGFANRPGSSTGAEALNYKRLNAVERSVREENKSVLEKFRHDGLPYRTVVFFAPVTKPSLPGRSGEVFLQQVQGVALAQRQANEEAVANENQMRIRLLIANPGDRFAAGVSVARKIAAMARHDRRIVAVVGVSQSRKESRDAIDVLTKNRLTVVASTITADEISRSPYFYQIAPLNKRQADAAARFALNAPIVKNGFGEFVGTDRAVVIQDPSDLYSQNLAEDFRQSFRAMNGKIAETFSYQPATDPADMVHDPRLGNRDKVVGNADDLARGVCEAIDTERAVVYYTQRAYDLPAFLDAVKSDPVCAGKNITVLSGDDGGGFVSDGETVHYPFLQFYYAAFSAPGHENNVGRAFLAEFVREFGSTVDPSYPALGFDSFLVAKEAIDKAYQSKDADFERSVVATKLQDGQIDFIGASGAIAFLGRRQVPVDRPIFILEALHRKGPSKVVLKCGRFTAAEDLKFWGAARQECPVDPSSSSP
ncbi:hypothetical protein OK074_5614 [Actinobacteria bacterium OK074]|nr:hypothetical protein OK074_5614 [Actinobacteria bacterium OK074]